jgi:hypothetical protein
VHQPENEPKRLGVVGRAFQGHESNVKFGEALIRLGQEVGKKIVHGSPLGSPMLGREPIHGRTLQTNGKCRAIFLASAAEAQDCRLGLHVGWEQRRQSYVSCVGEQCRQRHLQVPAVGQRALRLRLVGQAQDCAGRPGGPRSDYSDEKILRATGQDNSATLG